MSDQPSGLLSHLDRILLDAEAIQRRITELGQAMEQYLAPYPMVTAIAVMDGGLFFVADLLRAINLPMRLVTMGASSYHGTTQSSGEVRVQWPPALNLRGQHVLLLDDILDTGLTLGALQDRLQAEGVAKLTTGVLLRKKRPLARPVQVDYIGFEIEDEFVVGYGMDYQGRYRNLPCIGVLRSTGSVAQSGQTPMVEA